MTAPVTNTPFTPVFKKVLYGGQVTPQEANKLLKAPEVRDAVLYVVSNSAFCNYYLDIKTGPKAGQYLIKD